MFSREKNQLLKGFRIHWTSQQQQEPCSSWSIAFNSEGKWFSILNAVWCQTTTRPEHPGKGFSDMFISQVPVLNRPLCFFQMMEEIKKEEGMKFKHWGVDCRWEWMLMVIHFQGGGNFQGCCSVAGLEHRRTESPMETFTMKKAALICHLMGLILLEV